VRQVRDLDRLTHVIELAQADLRRIEILLVNS